MGFKEIRGQPKELKNLNKKNSIRVLWVIFQEKYAYSRKIEQLFAYLTIEQVDNKIMTRKEVENGRSSINKSTMDSILHESDL